LIEHILSEGMVWLLYPEMS